MINRYVELQDCKGTEFRDNDKYEIIGLNMSINSKFGLLTANEYIKSNRRQIILIVAVLLLAAGLRWLDLGAGSIWVDEANEYWTASKNLSQLFDQTRFTNLDPPLYTYFLHFWSMLGMSESFLRFPSLVFSLIGVAGAMAVGYRLEGRRTGLLAGFLVAISPTDIRYAQEVSQYTWMLSSIFWNYYVLLKISEQDKPVLGVYLAWLGLALIGTYTFYGVFFAVVIPFGLQLLLDLFARNWIGVTRKTLALLAYGLCLLPLLIFYLPYQMDWALGKPLSEVNMTLSIATIEEGFQSIAHSISFLFTGWPFTRIPEWLPVGIVAILVIENIATIHKSNQVKRFWLLWLIALFAIISLTSVTGIYPGGFRHGLFLLAIVIPFMSYRLVELFEAEWKKGLAIILLVTFTGASLISSPQRTLRNLIYPNESWPWPETNYNLRPAFTHWLDNRQTGEPIYIYFGGNLVFRYYLRLFGVDQCQLERPGNPCAVDDVIYGEWFNNQPDQAKINSVKHSLPDQVNSFWMLLTGVHSNDDELILKALQSDYQIVDQSISRGVQLYHFERVAAKK